MTNCDEPYIEENPMPKLVNSSESIFDEAKSYQMVSILKGAVDRGTGRKTKIDGIEIAGKTGTTNNNTDAWFIGFTSDLIIGVYAVLTDQVTWQKRNRIISCRANFS